MSYILIILYRPYHIPSQTTFLIKAPCGFSYGEFMTCMWDSTQTTLLDKVNVYSSYQLPFSYWHQSTSKIPPQCCLFVFHFIFVMDCLRYDIATPSFSQDDSTLPPSNESEWLIWKRRPGKRVKATTKAHIATRTPSHRLQGYVATNLLRHHVAEHRRNVSEVNTHSCVASFRELWLLSRRQSNLQLMHLLLRVLEWKTRPYRKIEWDAPLR